MSHALFVKGTDISYTDTSTLRGTPARIPESWKFHSWGWICAVTPFGYNIVDYFDGGTILPTISKDRQVCVVITADGKVYQFNFGGQCPISVQPILYGSGALAVMSGIPELDTALMSALTLTDDVDKAIKVAEGLIPCKINTWIHNNIDDIVARLKELGYTAPLRMPISGEFGNKPLKVKS